MKKVSYFLIPLGLLVALYPLISNLYGDYWQQRLLAEINEYVEEEEQILEEIRTSYEELSETLEAGSLTFDGVPEDTNEVETSRQEEMKTLAIIEIPKIDLVLPILGGTSEKNLSRAAGHIIGTALPGEIGNSAIAAHRAHTYGRFFNRLDELEVGDEIIIKMKGDVFVYHVYKTLVVEPSDLSVLRRNSKDRVLTLITCTPIYTATHRLVIHSILKDFE